MAALLFYLRYRGGLDKIHEGQTRFAQCPCMEEIVHRLWIFVDGIFELCYDIWDNESNMGILYAVNSLKV